MPRRLASQTSGLIEQLSTNSINGYELANLRVSPAIDDLNLPSQRPHLPDQPRNLAHQRHRLLRALPMPPSTVLLA